MPDFPVLVLLALVLSGLIYAALRLLFPAHKSPYQTEASFEELHARFRYTGFRQFAVMVGLTLAGCIAAYGLYQIAAVLLYSGSLAKSFHLIRPDRFARLLVALLGGGALGLALSPWAFRKLLGSEYQAYVDYQNRLTGLDNERTAKALSRVLLVTYAFVSALFLDWYTAFGPAGIRQAPLFSLQIREHTYADLARIEQRASFVRPDGKNCSRQHFLLHFASGQQWNSRNSGYETADRNADLLLFIQEKMTEAGLSDSSSLLPGTTP
ncbi:MAG: hypothetical protein GC205_05745 [Bacteroidetes bacterium]|nr:hypothetical protein [Bacteroidota bacterium]